MAFISNKGRDAILHLDNRLAVIAGAIVLYVIDNVYCREHFRVSCYGILSDECPLNFLYSFCACLELV